MKIDDISTMILRYTYEKGIADAQNFFAARNAVIVKVHTDSGIVGIGESASFGGPPQTTKYMIEQELKPMLIGEDPAKITWLWQKMFARTRQHGRGGIIFAAMSGIDIALWDIMGKIAGLPVYQLLGGYTDRLIPYASSGFYAPDKGMEQLKEEVRSYFEQGFCYAKIKIGRNPEVLMSPLPNMAYAKECETSLEEDLERVEACCRIAKEYNARIMVDANNNWNTFTAIRMGKLLQEMGVYWLEEPLHLDNIDGSAELAQALDMPVAGYESEIGFYRFRELMERRAVDIVQPDCIWSGGITECRRIADLALAHNLPCNPHIFSTGISLAANIHFLASLSNGGLLEMDRNFYPLRDELLDRKIDISEDGFVYVPQEPGLGISLNAECVEQYRIA